MNASPTPVHEIPTRSSAQVPAPIIGVSPILPSGFPVIPPVEVAAAILPSLSKATAPTVPIPSSENSVSTRPSKSWSNTASSSSVEPIANCECFHFFHWPIRKSVFNHSWETCSTPFCIAKSSADSLFNITGQPCFKIKFAARIGWRICLTLTTAPAALSSPLMMEASMVIISLAAITEPFPALNNGSSSSISTAMVTASKQSICPETNFSPT